MNAGAIRRRGWAAALLAALAPAAAALTLTVAPDGNDAADGSAAAPLASLEAALQRIGDAPTDGSTDRIVLRPGRYELRATLRIDTRARRPGHGPLVIEAQPTGRAILSGGAVLPPFEADAGVWRTRAPGSPPADLWVADRRATVARSPNGGDWYRGARNTSRPVPERPPLRVSLPANIDNTRRLVLPPDAQAELRRVLGPNGAVDGVQLAAIHSWAASRQFLRGFDAASGIAEVAPDGRWPFLQFDRDQRFALENHPGFLDAPGEWWAAPDGQLRYLPRPGDSAREAVAVVARLQTLLAVAGEPDRSLRTIVLRGLRLQHAAAVRTPHVDGQAATSVPAAVVADRVQGLEIDQCAFEHLGGHALWLRRGVVDGRVRRNHFRDLGGGGIRIGEAEVPADPADATGRVRVENNLVEDGGRNFASAVGIWVGQSGDNTIAHNEVRDFDYSGISVGWRWSFGATPAVRNRIEANHVHDVGRGVLSDLGGIYTLGESPGTVIRGNLIERVVSGRQQGGSTAFGIYLDQASSGLLVEDNVSLGSTGGGFHLHWGRDNVVRNNVFDGGLLAQAKRVRGGADASLVFERNVLVGASPGLYQGEWSDTFVRTARNLLQPAARSVDTAGHSLAELQARGQEAGSVAGDLALQCDRRACAVAEALARATGFRTIDLTRAGIVDRGETLPR